jgi:predicted permease
MVATERPVDGLPRLPAALLRRLLPYAEREEVMRELAAEYRTRVESEGDRAAREWLWRQALASAPALARRGWWRGWSGFEPRANRWTPGGAMFESWGQEVRYSLRRLRRRPTYTVLAVLTLALGVAGTAAIYGIAKRLLLEPLPVRNEEEVVQFWFTNSWSPAEMLYLRPEMKDFRSVAAVRSRDVTLAPGGGPAKLVHGVSGTSELFRVLGVGPEIGPGFQPGNDRPGSEPQVVLSHSLWRELGADPAIVGKRVELSGVPRTVVGVMPEGFWFPDPTTRVWLSQELDPEDNAGNYTFYARMPPGASVAAMDGQLRRITGLLAQRFQYPEQWDKTKDPKLTPLREALVGTVRPAVLAMLAAMGVILLIACVNVAALMLGQVDGRATELAVRSALGAGRARLLRQLVVEALLLGVLAGLVGAGLAVLGFPVLLGALPLGALAEGLRVDWTVFLSAMTLSLLAAMVVALAPGFSVAREDLQSRLTRSRTSGIGGRGGRLESGLVVAQVALVLLMAAGAALLIRSVENLRAIDPGLEVEGRAVASIVMPASSEDARRPQVLQEMIRAVEALPGVQSAAFVQRLPLSGGGDNWGIRVEGQPEGESSTTAFRMVTPGYFETMGIRVLSGHGFRDADRAATGEGTVIINQALADKYFPGVDPLGRRIALGDQWERVVGVVENVAEKDLSPEPEPARYVPYEQLGGAPTANSLVIRMRPGRHAAGILESARRAIQRAAPGVAVQETTTMESIFSRAIGPARQVMALLTLLSVLALALGSIGVYGVVSHFVTRRRRDWGIRIALGLHPSRVIARIVARGGALVGGGIAVGLLGFLLLARLLASFLYGVGTADPLSLAAAAAILLAAGLVAAYVPARRASRIDPALVLREQ